MRKRTYGQLRLLPATTLYSQMQGYRLQLVIVTQRTNSASVAELHSLHCEVQLEVVFPRPRLFRTHAFVDAEKTIICFSTLQVILTTEETALFEIKNIKEGKQHKTKTSVLSSVCVNTISSHCKYEKTELNSNEILGKLIEFYKLPKFVNCFTTLSDWRKKYPVTLQPVPGCQSVRTLEQASGRQAGSAASGIRE